MDRWRTVQPSEVRKGDLATHLSGTLDARQVTRVAGDQVWLWILTSEVGPLSLYDYEYQRKVD